MLVSVPTPLAEVLTPHYIIVVFVLTIGPLVGVVIPDKFLLFSPRCVDGVLALNSASVVGVSRAPLVGPVASNLVIIVIALDLLQSYDA